MTAAKNEQQLEIDIRPARAEDYGGVLEVGENIYGGFDYLPELYFWMIHTKENHPFVAVAGGKVVGFNNYKLINDGKTVITMASRVHQAYQGLGINEKMKEEISKSMRQKYPSLVSRIWTSFGNEAEDRYFKKNPGKFQQLFQWKILRYAFFRHDTMTQPQILKECSRTCTKKDGLESSFISYSGAIMLIPQILTLLRNFTLHINYSEFYPWVGLETNEANIRYVIMISNVIVSFSESNSDQEKRLAAVSFSPLMQVNASGLSSACHMVYYGDSPSGFFQHLELIKDTIRSVVPTNCDSMVLALLHPSNMKIDKEMVSAHLGSSFIYFPFTEKRTDGYLTSAHISD